ncbi:MAG TPA: HAD family hydrolase [Bryobacteraceae bacterium]|nr:HAD family hydrolase [Bryobacteraceae bacterium]
MVQALRAVIVDVDGTLYDLARVRRRMAWRLLRFSACRPREGWKTIRALRAFRMAQERMRPGAGGSVSPAQDPGEPGSQAEWAAKLSGYPADFIRRCAAKWMDCEPLEAVAEARLPGVAEFLFWANEIGLPVAAASDYDPRAKLRALGFERQITAAVWAQQAEIGAFKPSPRLLLAAASKLGVRPAEALYVGDRQEVDGAAAQAAGMPVIVLAAGRGWREVRDRVAAAIAPDRSEVFVGDRL